MGGQSEGPGKAGCRAASHMPTGPLDMQISRIELLDTNSRRLGPLASSHPSRHAGEVGRPIEGWWIFARMHARPARQARVNVGTAGMNELGGSLKLEAGGRIRLVQPKQLHAESLTHSGGVDDKRERRRGKKRGARWDYCGVGLI